MCGLEERGGSFLGDETRQVASVGSKLRSLRAPVALSLALLSQHRLLTYRENQTNFLFRNLYHLQSHFRIDTPRTDEHFGVCFAIRKQIYETKPFYFRL
jgi:hypothetical protein